MINIRNFKKEDAPVVAELVKQLTPNIVEPENLVSRLEKMAEAQNYQYFVALMDEQVVGFAGLAWYQVASKGLRGWIEEVVVDKKYRGLGIGQKLIEQLLKLAVARNIKQVLLITANPMARHLYEKFGFEKREDNVFHKKYY